MQKVNKVKHSKEDYKYIQQHLVTERTFLAWIRFAITLIGLGYLAVKLHIFSSELPFRHSDIYTRLIGMTSIIVGIITIIFSVVNYFRKRKAINQQSFVATITPIWIIGIGSILPLLLIKIVKRSCYFCINI
jgi:putative membrane protein